MHVVRRQSASGTRLSLLTVSRSGSARFTPAPIASGHAELRVCKGEYQLHLWRNGHLASPQPIRIDGDMRLALTMLHVPEEHPDARWVR